MKSFLERFYEGVDDNLDDPHTSKRVTLAKKLNLLYVAEKMIWERVMMISGQESVPGRTEIVITIEDDKQFYPLPGNFRQFIRFEKRVDGDPNNVEALLPSIPLFSEDRGVHILSEQRGMMVEPKPAASEAGDWTLIYQKGPVRLHHATAAAVGDKTLTGALPDINAGELVLNAGYYEGSLIYVYAADAGQYQPREVESWDPVSKVFHLRHAWGTVPTGTIKYEVRPVLPPDYDDLYAMDVAIRLLGARRQNRGRAGLKQDRNDLWQACKGYFLSNVADRGPARLLPVNRDEIDPYVDM